MPDTIEAGIRNVSKRGDWNKPASEEYALPTETWREVVARRQRYENTWLKIAGGEIRDINDFITYNLNIREFAKDIIEYAEGTELVRAFWKGLTSVTVLDPTCGSGAFLFAALGILEELYDACLKRMQAFIDDTLEGRSEEHSTLANTLEECTQTHRALERYSDFRQVLANVDHHPNSRYFVLKSIILNNLYGVDIMEEATEICKLRLFLKLVAQLQTAEQVEPLPDIDFNIRSGNTLVGFVNYADVERAVTSKFDFYNSMEQISAKAEMVDAAYVKFREMQIQQSVTSAVLTNAKSELQQHLDTLNHTLNGYLSQQYDILSDNKVAFERWRATHQPFHWFVAFYGIMKSGGFDVVIGNPPYVEYSKVRGDYTVNSYKTEKCGNLYAYVVERSYKLAASSRLGMIIPLAAFGVTATKSLRDFICSNTNILYVSHFSGDAHPSVLFEGVKLRLSILVTTGTPSNAISSCTIYSTPYLRWYATERSILFYKIAYTKVASSLILDTFPKVGSSLEESILQKIRSMGRPMSWYLRSVGSSFAKFYYHNAPVFYIRAMDFVPLYESANSTGPSSNHFKTLYAEPTWTTPIMVAILNSSLFYVWFTNYSGCRDLTSADIATFRITIDKVDAALTAKLQDLVRALMEDLKHNSIIREYNYRTGLVRYQEFYMRKSKNIIDKIDLALSQHYGLTSNELDFIINYDIKYRMGRDNDEGEGE